MKTLLLFTAIAIPALSTAQPPNASNILEGGKTLIELIRVIKPQRNALNTTAYQSPDSCSQKRIADISFKNKTDKTMIVSLFYRAGNVYEQLPSSLLLSPATQESLYELRAGIYKYKIESDSSGQRKILHGGELKLAPCEKAVKDIRG